MIFEFAKFVSVENIAPTVHFRHDELVDGYRQDVCRVLVDGPEDDDEQLMTRAAFHVSVCIVNGRPQIHVLSYQGRREVGKISFGSFRPVG
jgi:hypothetical protein